MKIRVSECLRGTQKFTDSVFLSFFVSFSVVRGKNGCSLCLANYQVSPATAGCPLWLILLRIPTAFCSYLQNFKVFYIFSFKILQMFSNRVYSVVIEVI